MAADNMREHYESDEWADGYADTTSPVDEPDPRMVEAQTRIDRIVTKLNTFNRANPQQALMLNGQLMEMAAGLDALAGALIDAGLLTTEDYAVRRAERIADMFEAAWEQSAPDRRRATRLVVPGR